MSSRFASLCARLKNDAGNVAIIFALSLPILVGSAGFGVETTYWFYKRQELQNAADQAAYAGALERRGGGNHTAIEAMATEAAVDNGFDTTLGVIDVNSPPDSGPNQNNQAVEVLLEQRQQRFFTRIFSNESVVAHARSVARFQSSAEACVLALDRTASRAADFAGSSNTTFSGCSVMANSIANDAVNIQGAGDLTATCVVAVGGVSSGPGLHLTSCEEPVAQAPPAADPFADLPVPTASGACQNDNHSPLDPGRYCNGMNLSGNVHLNPGVYLVDGDFRVNANANVTGTGVTIYVTGGGRVTMNGNATVNLSAPTSGTYSGVLFYGDRSSSGGTNKFNGTTNSSLTGAIYFADQQIEYLGDFSGLNGCVQVVGRTVKWSGNASVASDCTAHGMRAIPVLQIVELVE